MFNAEREPSCDVQSRLEAIVSVQQRQNNDLRDVSIFLSQTLARLRGEHPQALTEKKDGSPSGIIHSLERGLQDSESLIQELKEIESELRSLI